MSQSIPQFRTFVLGLWQRLGRVSSAIQDVQAQPVTVFAGEKSEIVLDVHDELGSPFDLTGSTSTLAVTKQFNGAPPLLSIAAVPAVPPVPNRVVFVINAVDLPHELMGRYVYNVVTTLAGGARVTVPLSLFHITPTVA